MEKPLTMTKLSKYTKPNTNGALIYCMTSTSKGK